MPTPKIILVRWLDQSHISKILKIHSGLKGKATLNRFIKLIIFLISVFPQLSSGSEIYLPTRRIDSANQLTNTLIPKVTEFPNGNLFVRLNPIPGQKHLSFRSRDIIISTKPNISDDDLIEILMISFTSMQYFPKKISLQVDDNRISSSLPDELFHSLLFSAGVRQICFKNKKCLDTQPQHFPELSFPGQENASVIGNDYQKLMESMAKTLNLTHLNPKLLPPTLKNTLVYIILPVHAPGNKWLLNSLHNAYNVIKKGGYPFLVAPYLPYARTDKPERTYGAATGGRLIANLIEASGFKAAAFVRPHAPQSLGFFNIPVIEVSGRKTINTYLKNKNIDAIVSPDAGFQKDASKYAQELNKEIFVFNKVRGIDGKAKILTKENQLSYAGKTLAVIDDETASGSTLAMVATALKEQGAKKVIAIVTHLAGPANKALNCSCIDELIVTDTIPINQKPSEKFTILQIESELSEALKTL